MESEETTNDESLWRLRREDSTQYFTLVKMHLSFATDLSTDQCDGSLDVIAPVSGSKWNLTPLKKKFGRNSNSGKNIMDSAPLSEDLVYQAFQLIEFLGREENLSQEGLFRKTGSISRQQELKSLFYSGEVLNLNCGMFSAHDCASVLKNFLAELQEPLLQEGHYHVHCRIADMCGKYLDAEQQSTAYAQRIRALRLVFLLLPKLNYDLLRNLLILLNCVATNQKENKMSSSNLGTMFAPHILCPRKMTANDLQNLSSSLSTAVAFMIENALSLFQVPLELEIDVHQYWNNKIQSRKTSSKSSLQEAPSKTMFTFIDRELTAQANDKDVTQMALAELYAYVQGLPDSVKKRKLIKQFNGASGHGTPTLNSFTKKDIKVKNIGESIKRHLFAKTIRPSKTKTQSMKNENSTSTLCCSPELKLFRRTSAVVRSKTPHKETSEIAKEGPEKFSNELQSCNPVSPAYQDDSKSTSENFQTPVISKRNLARQFTGSSPKRFVNTSSCQREFSTPVNFNNPLLSGDFLRSTPHQNLPPRPNLRTCPSVISIIPSSRVFEDSFDCRNLSGLSNIAEIDEKPTLQENSPITRALMKSNVEQKIIMTPRSRCPIIMNSSSSLSSVAIEEQPRLEESEGDKENDLASSNISTGCIYPHSSCTNTSNKTICNTRNKESLATKDESDVPSKGMKSSTSGSLLGSFFKHLSTSSLSQLASRLTSISSLSSSNEVPSPQSPQSNDDSLDDSHTEFNESLSNVFKDYLLSRSILTDNPIDLSTDVFVDDVFEDEHPDSAYGDSLPPSKVASRQCSKASLESQDSLPIDVSTNNFSDSMLYCLDGNNPFNSSYTQDCHTYKRSKNSLLEADIHHSKKFDLNQLGTNKLNQFTKSSQSDSIINSSKFSSNKRKSPDSVEFHRSEMSEGNLHSCTPEGRRKSHFKNKNGTPVPHRDHETQLNSAESVKSILFETSF